MANAVTADSTIILFALIVPFLILKNLLAFIVSSL